MGEWGEEEKEEEKALTTLVALTVIDCRVWRRLLLVTEGGRTDMSARLRKGPAPCACGLHASGDEAQGTGLPPWRIRELNDGDRCGFGKRQGWERKDAFT